MLKVHVTYLHSSPFPPLHLHINHACSFLWNFLKHIEQYGREDKTGQEEMVHHCSWKKQNKTNQTPKPLVYFTTKFLQRNLSTVELKTKQNQNKRKRNTVTSYRVMLNTHMHRVKMSFWTEYWTESKNKQHHLITACYIYWKRTCLKPRTSLHFTSTYLKAQLQLLFKNIHL